MAVDEYPQSHGSLAGLSDSDHHQQYAFQSAGLLANRPTVHRVNQLYLATDAGVRYISDGTSWTPLVTGTMPSNMFAAPFHAGGSVPIALLKPKFLAPVDMTLTGARAWCETMATNGVAFQVFVNGVSVSGAAYTLAAAATSYVHDFTDVNINTGDRVQLNITTSDATATELSVTVYGFTR